MTRPRILILGGTGDGLTLADTLVARADIDVVSSLAGVTEAPRVPAGRVRRGGFGGVAGLTAYLREQAIAAIIDATHPFAATMSANADAAATLVGVPLVHLWRPPWTRAAGDRWIEVASVTDAAAAIPDAAGRVFLATGRSELAAFAARKTIDFLARIVQPVQPAAGEQWPPRLAFVYARGPFSLVEDRRLLIEQNIAVIVSKNSGGAAAYAKIAAARELELPVIMVRRPLPPRGQRVETVAAALAWLEVVLASRMN